MRTQAKKAALAVVAVCGGTLVKSYGIAGAFLGPTTFGAEPAKASDAQVITATGDTTYSKSLITDVLVLIGVNNEGGYLPTAVEARAHFAAMGALYPNARLWFVPNSRKNIATGGTNDPWRLYARLAEGASMAGFAVSQWSPMWHWGTARDELGYWDVAANVHMSAPGQTAWAKRLAGFLSGEQWRPHFSFNTTIHADAVALAAGATVSQDDSFIDGDTLHLAVAISGMDALSAVSTAAYVNVLQIPAHYAPVPGSYAFFPAGCRLTGGTMDFTYAARVIDGGIVQVDARLLNNHVAYFVLRTDLRLRLAKG